jgi:hypothetical protein
MNILLKLSLSSMCVHMKYVCMYAYMYVCMYSMYKCINMYVCAVCRGSSPCDQVLGPQR